MVTEELLKDLDRYEEALNSYDKAIKHPIISRHLIIKVMFLRISNVMRKPLKIIKR